MSDQFWHSEEQLVRIKPVMDSTFPLKNAADAHRRIESAKHIGKIVPTLG